jgi:methyl-accepting chemotaxis protein
MTKFGIHARLLLAVFLLIGITTIGLGYLGVSISHRFVQTRFDERMRFLARNLAMNAELGLLLGDRVMLERLARSVLTEKDMVEVSVVDSRGVVYTEVRAPISGEQGSIEAPVVLKEGEDESRAFLLHDDPVSREKIIGKVRITYSTEGMREMIESMKTRFFFLAVGLTGLFLLMFALISRSLVAPVTQLAHAARQVAKGERELRVRPGNLPETRELALAFNAMLDSLDWSSKALEDAYQEMLQQKTLAEMGKFSMMIAHEVKNPLSIIKTSLDMLKKEHGLAQDDVLVAYMDGIFSITAG